MTKQIFKRTEILLPRDTTPDAMRKWSVVACDQYTSEPEYWDGVETVIGDAPSTRRITYPELYLNAADKDERISAICRSMEEYRTSVLKAYPDCMIYVEREMKNGKKRCGIVGAFDLEAYSYEKGAQPPIRATEGTVLERIPPRVEIRRGAEIELPHVMMLIDDREKSVIEPITAKKKGFERAYSFTLMQNGGEVEGYFVDKESEAQIEKALDKLCNIDEYNKKYGTNEKKPMLFAVGDGNHSLATAKALWGEIKEKLGEDAKNHPARYALVEIVNIHDAALEFEPIYRVIFECDSDKVMSALKAYAEENKGGENAFEIECVSEKTSEKVIIKNSKEELAVGALQKFIDKYLKENAGYVDYIHGVESTKTLANKENAIGFLFDGMGKDELFKSVILGGSLPRKTFSMGEAHDKRYYLEARKIVK